MNVNEKTRGLVEASILTGLICIFAFAGLYIPLLSFFLLFVPVILIVLGVRRSIGFSILAIVASSLIMISLSDPLTAMFIISFPGVAAVVIVMLMKKKVSHKTIMFSGTLASIITTILSFFITAKIMGIDMLEKFTYLIKESIEMQIYMYNKIGDTFNLDPAVIAEQISKIEAAEPIIVKVIPVALILSSFLSIYINYFLALKVLNRTGTKVDEIEKFRYFKLSKNTMVGVLLIYLLSLLVGRLNIVDNDMLMTNVAIFIQYVFIVQGVALLIYYLIQYKIGKLLKTVILIMLLTSGFGFMTLFYIGILETILNLRKYKPETENN